MAEGKNEEFPWGIDFVNEGRLIGVTKCDKGATEFKSYVGEMGCDQETPSYRGMTVSINGAVRYYIFSPNPNSMSPIVMNFEKSEDGNLREVSSKKRDEVIKAEAPNLYALFVGEENDGETERFEQ